jgi:hypothetical protein
MWNWDGNVQNNTLTTGCLKSNRKRAIHNSLFSAGDSPSIAALIEVQHLLSLTSTTSASYIQ